MPPAAGSGTGEGAATSKVTSLRNTRELLRNSWVVSVSVDVPVRSKVKLNGADPGLVGTDRLLPLIETEPGWETPPAPLESSKWKVALVNSQLCAKLNVMVGLMITQPTYFGASPAFQLPVAMTPSVRSPVPPDRAAPDVVVEPVPS